MSLRFKLVTLAPLGTGGINKSRSYYYAVLALLATCRHGYLYVVHSNPQAERIVNEEVSKTNRNNGIWKTILESKVSKVTGA
jgi:hypothetical protein